MSTAPAVPLVKGFRDVLPDEYALWLRFERLASEHFARYGFAPIALPVLERVELFSRSLGAASDVVSKEMFSFVDRDGTGVTLRPEATASAARAYIGTSVGAQGGVARYWYAGPMFRRERPQRGRHRQFQQIGVEAFGDAAPTVDAEILVMLMDYLESCEARDVSLLLGSLGDEACRPAYRTRLLDFARERAGQLCATCRERMERNPLRLLDCKSKECQAALAGAPVPLDHLCSACTEHFGAVRRLLDSSGTRYEVAPRLVRGLDYYSRTTFEVVAGGLGAQNAVGGGGRYDGLVASLGGPAVPGFGFAVGVDRLALSSGHDGTRGRSRHLVSILALDDAASVSAISLATRLRRSGWRVQLQGAGRSLKAMLRAADRDGAQVAVLIGPEEVACGMTTVRDLAGRRDHPGAFRIDADAAEFEEWWSAQGREREA